MPTLISRRTALRRIGLALGGIATAPVLSGVLGGCATPSGEAAASYTYQTLGKAQQRTIAALVDQIIPATDTPGASDVGVPQFIDLMLTDWYDAEDRTLFLASLDEVNVRADSESFADLDAEAQAALAAELDAEAYALRETEDASGDVAGAGQAGTSAAQEEQEREVATGGNRAGTGETGGDPNARPPAEEIEVDPDAPPFFRQLKELTLAGYYTSEAGATEELRWNPAPGRYDADVPYSDIGRAWA